MRINFRYIVLAVMGTAAMLALLGESEYILGTIAEKVFGFTCLFVLCKLYRKWNKNGTIKKLSNLVDYDEH